MSEATFGSKLTMNLGPRSYDITLRRGALQNLYQLADLNRRVAVVTDSGVPPVYARQVADQCREAVIITVPQGEGSKCLRTLESVLQQMLAFGMGPGRSGGGRGRRRGGRPGRLCGGRLYAGHRFHQLPHHHPVHD